MQRLLNLFLLAVLISPLAHAQLDSADRKLINQAAFSLTKVTVEFVATDTKTYGNRKLTTCETCNDYPSLVQFIKINKLTKADELVNDAQKKTAALTTPTATADQILNGLRQYLHDRVTKGDGRERRTTLPSYKKYTDQVAQILASAGVESASTESVAAVPSDTISTDEPVVSGSSVTKAETGGLLSFGGIAFILSLINLAGLVYLWLQRQANAAPVVRNPVVDELSSRVSMLEKKQKDLVSQLNRPAAAPAAASSDSRRPESAPNQADRSPASMPQNRPAEPAAPKPAAAIPVPEPPRPVQTPPATQMPVPTPRPTGPAPTVPTQQPASPNQPAPGNQPRRREVVLYGRTADLGDGFSVGGLLETPDRDTVFQIEVRTDSQAVYRITEEPGAQQLALSDPYSYLADACEYMAKPVPNARIRTNQPGQLALQGDKWKIVEKAKISFY